MTVRSIRSAVGHVPLEEIFTADREATVLYARMLDGRTIYQHILFVEPRLRAANPSLCSVLPSSDSLHAESVVAFSCPVRRELVSSFYPRMTITRAILKREGSSLDIAEPLRGGTWLEDTGFLLFAQLAVPEIADVTTSRADAMRALSVAALHLLWLWARAETRYGADLDAPLPPSARRFLESHADVFVASILIEFLRRSSLLTEAETARMELGEALGFGALLVSRVAEGEEYPLSHELVAYWLPLWNRSAVIFSSPFDPMSELDTLAD
jgi:hypothetical protein